MSVAKVRFREYYAYRSVLIQYAGAGCNAAIKQGEQVYIGFMS